MIQAALPLQDHPIIKVEMRCADFIDEIAPFARVDEFHMTNGIAQSDKPDIACAERAITVIHDPCGWRGLLRSQFCAASVYGSVHLHPTRRNAIIWSVRQTSISGADDSYI